MKKLSQKQIEELEALCRRTAKGEKSMNAVFAVPILWSALAT
jgi:hypothetical protein